MKWSTLIYMILLLLTVSTTTIMADGIEDLIPGIDQWSLINWIIAIVLGISAVAVIFVKVKTIILGVCVLMKEVGEAIIAAQEVGVSAIGALEDKKITKEERVAIIKEYQEAVEAVKDVLKAWGSVSDLFGTLKKGAKTFKKKNK